MSNKTSSEISLSNTCANCGKEGSDVTNTCNKCKSVMYCNAACKKKHRSKHKKACERRAAELHDEKLFKQPPLEEDCPICFMRLPMMPSGQTYMACCGKVICSGCIYTVQSRAYEAGRSEEDEICPFCRTPAPSTDEECIKQFKKRMEMNDANAILSQGGHYFNGLYGLPQNHAKALELWHRAAKLGNADANYNIGNAYYNGTAVERDMKKAIYYTELAAMGGDVNARCNLGGAEGNKGNMERALKHFMIAVRSGCADSLEYIKRLYSKGHATKDDYTNALRSYQAYVDEIKSDQRDKAAAFIDRNIY